MSQSLDPQPGQAVYSGGILAIYDTAVLKIVQPLAWRCPAKRILDLYDRHTSADHLDIGVGTGYFLNRCEFREPNPRLTLLDMNANSLASAKRRLHRYDPTTVQTNVLEPIDLPTGQFGSVGMNCLLHCLPGTLSDKAPALTNVKKLMRPGGVLFGTTVLIDGVKHNTFGRRIYSSWNARGIWSNLSDNMDGLEEILSQNFVDYEVNLVGRSAMFVATA